MRVLLASGGDIPIPPPRWGGVENLIWQQKRALEDAGHEVAIFNNRLRGPRKYAALLRARPWRYDVVHLHHDSHVRHWLPLSRLFRFPLAVSTHYGYAAFPDKWSRSYRRTFRALRRARYLLLLSHEQETVFRSLGCRARTWALPNGIHCDQVRFAPASSKSAIVLGRVEERKKQAWLARHLDVRTVKCDFAGPLADPEFAANDRNTRYLGEWSREQVHDCLTEYACLVLLSDGEGHAAVVSEAMAAGLSLVLSPEASHNLDLSQPGITVVSRDHDDVGDAIERAVRDNAPLRSQIRRYCQEHFDWSVILPRYVHILGQIGRGGE